MFSSPPTQVKIINLSFLSPFTVTQLNHTPLGLQSFRLLTSLCHLIDRFFFWTIARECYSYLILASIPRYLEEINLDAFVTYLHFIREMYVLPLVTLVPSTANDMPPGGQSSPTFNLNSLTMGHFPLSLLECFVSYPALSENGHEASMLLETGSADSDLSVPSCLQIVTISRIALNTLRLALFLSPH
jgi:hypothetical protein